LYKRHCCSYGAYMKHGLYPLYFGQRKGEMMEESIGRLAKVIEGLGNKLWSPNEADTNLEPANIVDALCILARALNCAFGKDGGIVQAGLAVRAGLDNVASAINGKADAISANTEAVQELAESVAGHGMDADHEHARQGLVTAAMAGTMPSAN
jgi:hypothetical protein